MPQIKKIDLNRASYDTARDAGITITQLLERDDPTEGYTSTPLAKTDAFQRQILTRGLTGERVSLASFYEPTNRALFPEFIRRQINTGKVIGRNQVMVADLIAMTTEIDGGTYTGPIADLDSATEYAEVPEGAPFPETVLATDSDILRLVKFGRKLRVTYEAQRRATPISWFAWWVQQIGSFWARQQASLALTVAVAGLTPASADADLTYADLVDLNLSFDPYDQTMLVAPTAGVAKILKMSEFKDQITGAKFQETGGYPTPFGCTMKRHSGSLPVLTNKVVGLDTTAALELVRERQASLVETDKIIDGQWDQMVISEVLGFRRLQAGAVKVMSYTPGD